ncbi:DUF5677 domain-containing protein [Salinisphaera sp. G21_0]|uniref:DUF5677 domain-containing protein n=1 Tax=Salinisphaera sp. G21_0 TaxID=2821094 RepID=UPI001ADC354D|nr:DUF5677 domain-containing protein [Salinisphaera sp. G21_0]MBO9484007.1 hypothetical protein [Salinisphaera sp. G21_0]
MQDKMYKTEEITTEVIRSKLILDKLDSNSLDESKVLALKFWNKFIQNNECVASLINNDYIDEAYTIYRLSMEHLFNMFALVRNPEFIAQLINSSKVSIPKSLKGISKNEDQADEKMLTPENARLLKEEIDIYEANPLKNLGYSIYNAAQASELKDFYDSVYRAVSLSYSHSTFLSVIINKKDNDVISLIENAVAFLKTATALIEEEF